MDIPVLLAVMGSDTSGDLLTYECIRYEGQIWLVPAWRVHRSEGWRTPVRMIRVPPTDFQEVPFGGHDLLIKKPVPTAVVNGQHPSPLKLGYVVQEAPDLIRVPSRKTS